MNNKIDNIRKYFYLYKKRHPRLVMTILMFIIIPLATGTILGYEMSDNVASSIPTVVVDHDNSDFSRDYLRYIDESESFNIIEYAQKDERVEQLIEESKAFVGVIIPQNFYSDMIEGKAPKILNIYDGSTMAVVGVSKPSMTEIVMTVKAAYMKKIYEGKQSVVPTQVMNQVVPIQVTYRELYNPTRNFRNFLLPGMLVGLIQVGIAIMGSERGFENQRKEISFLSNIKLIIGWGFMGAISIFLCLIVQFLFYDMPYKGTLAGGVLLTILFSICITALGYIVGSFLSDRTFATQVSALTVLPTTFLGGYTWPVIGMPVAFQWISKFLPFTYYGDAVRELCLRPMEFHHLLPDMIFMVKFIIAELLILYLVKRFTTHKEEMEEDEWGVVL
ncbi:ABC transporter permease [Anaerovorax odorimutans]|uniref:ABC transporter permease n=1 Tax=Anaerovorax odorimutans TaxID=109327 RepID=UPI00040E19CF|nr:ABC transporter permease [Anaerovorax odorimutans]